MSLKIIWGDIVREPTDALVTLASREARVGSGVDKSVHKAAGEELLKARLKATRKCMGPGVAVSTKAFGLKKTCGAKNVIHVSSVFWEGGGHDEAILLDAVYLKAVVFANALNAKIVTLPVMGAGKYGMPKKKALDQAVTSLKECAQFFPDLLIKLVVVDLDIFDYARKEYPNLCESHFSAKEEAKLREVFPVPQRDEISNYYSPLLYSENESEYWKNFKLRQFEKIDNFTRMLNVVWDVVRDRDLCIHNGTKNQLAMTDGFGRPLVYNQTELAGVCGVTKSTLKHIFAGESQRPARDVVLALCVALRLPMPYIKILLRKCGYDFKSDAEERIIENNIRNGDTELWCLNEALVKELGKDAALYVGVKRRRCNKSRKVDCRARSSGCKKRRRV